jgi:hypothetical protein
MPLCRRGDLTALWRGEGMQDVAEEALTIETRFASFDDFWRRFWKKQGPAGAYAASLSAEDREALRLRLRRRMLAQDRTRSSSCTRALGPCAGRFAEPSTRSRRRAPSCHQSRPLRSVGVLLEHHALSP